MEDNRTFDNEDTSKPENRVNIALFHLLMIDEIKDFLLERFGLERDCVIYPSINLAVTDDFGGGGRPDYKIVLNGEVVGYVEVELGKDDAQVERYRQLTGKPIYSIYGKIEHGGNLSLEELYDVLCVLQEKTSKSDQSFWSMNVLIGLIKYHVIDGNFAGSNKRTSISDAMREHPVMRAIYESLPDDKILDEKGAKIKQGKLLVETIKENGFSVRIYSRIPKNKTFSIVARNGGSGILEFPSYIKMKKYMCNDEFAREYADILVEAGARDINEKTETQKVTLELSDLQSQNSIKKLIDCVIKHYI